jgi:hypothetical protein
MPVTNEDQVHVALPKLYGAPAYARPKATPVATVDRPFDPDSLPLESQQTDAERELTNELAARPWDGSEQADALGSSREGSPMLRGRPFRLGSITRRIRGNGASHEG